MRTKKKMIDRLGIWHLEESRLNLDTTPRMRRSRDVALEIVALDERAERYLVKYLKKRDILENKMRNMK